MIRNAWVMNEINKLCNHFKFEYKVKGQAVKNEIIKQCNHLKFEY